MGQDLTIADAGAQGPRSTGGDGAGARSASGHRWGAGQGWAGSTVLLVFPGILRVSLWPDLFCLGPRDHRRRSWRSPSRQRGPEGSRQEGLWASLLGWVGLPGGPGPGRARLKAKQGSKGWIWPLRAPGAGRRAASGSKGRRLELVTSAGHCCPGHVHCSEGSRCPGHIHRSVSHRYPGRVHSSVGHCCPHSVRHSVPGPPTTQKVTAVLGVSPAQWGSRGAPGILPVA